MATSITVQTGAAVAIAGAVAQIFENGVKLKGRGTTNGSGIVSFSSLADGVYDLTLSKDGYVFPTYRLTIATEVATPATVTGTSITTTSPTKPSTCRVYAHLFDVRGNPVQVTAIVENIARGERSAVNTGGAGAAVTPFDANVVPGKWEVRSRLSDGLLSFDAAIDSVLSVRIHELGFTRIFRVPNQSALNLRDARAENFGSEDGGTAWDAPEHTAFTGESVG